MDPFSCLKLPQCYYSIFDCSCSRALPITVTVTMASTSVDLEALSQSVVVLLPQLIPMDAMKGSEGLLIVPE